MAIFKTFTPSINIVKITFFTAKDAPLFMENNLSDLTKKQFDLHKKSWINSARNGFTVDENNLPIPWYTFDAIEFLKNNLNKNHFIFEFGCGASTLFFASKVQKIISLESNRRWFEIITAILKNSGDFLLEKNFFANANCEIFLNEQALDCDDYQHFAKDYSQKNNLKFDFLIVDSLKRFECVKNSYTSIKNDGYLILDDSERPNYRKIFDFLQQNNFSAQDFIGIAPAQLRIKKTTFFRC